MNTRLQLDPEAVSIDATLNPGTVHHDPQVQHTQQELSLPRGDALSKPIRVAVVDDEPMLLELFKRRLEMIGYVVICFESGESMIEQLLEIKVDFVILDVQLPGISGLHVLEYIIDTIPDMMVIMSTAYSSEEILVDALRRGAYDYLRKPTSDRDLRAMLGRVNGTLALKRENLLLQQQLEEKQLRLATELARAAQVQADLLPHSVPDLPGYNLAARCLPARDVGGDFYDWQVPRDGLLNLMFGDVMGKGMPAALLMTTVRAVFRSTIRAVSPHINISYAAAVLEPDLDRANSFVTLFHAQLDVQSGVVRYVDCGHGCAFVLRMNGEIIEELEPRGVPVGLPRSDPFAEGQVTLQPGDALVIYSDGLLDARPDLLAPGNQAIAHHIEGCHDAETIVQRLINLAQLDGLLPDDLTVMVLVRTA